MNSFNMTQVLRHAESEPDIAGKRNYRTRNEGVHYRKKGLEGTHMKDILTPQLKLPQKPPPKKKEPKDFRLENIRKVKQMSLQRQQQSNIPEAKKPLRATWAAAYPQVPSNVFAELEERIRKDIEKAQTRQRPQSQQTLNRTKSDVNLTAKKTSNVVHPSEKNPMDSVNFIRRNSLLVKETPQRSRSIVNLKEEPLKDLESVPKGKIGALPKPLENEKDIIDRARKITSDAELYGLPPGSYLMDESERLRLTEELSEAKVKKEREIFLLPVRTDTLRARRKREELEKALVEIDEGLKILSKPKVIVEDPDYVQKTLTAARTIAEHKKRSLGSLKDELKRPLVATGQKKASQPQPLQTGQTKFFKQKLLTNGKAG